MTSKFSIDNRELLQRISSGEAVVGIDFGNLIVRELAAFRLAAMDSEPDRNPVLAYADSYRDMAKQGVESVPIWSVITDLERNVAPLYRHAQPVLEIESEPVFTLEVTRADYKGQKLGNHFGFITLDAARELKEGNYQLYTAQPAPVVPEEITSAIEGLKQSLVDCNRYNYCFDAVTRVENACRAAMLAAAPQEVKK